MSIEIEQALENKRQGLIVLDEDVDVLKELILEAELDSSSGQSWIDALETKLIKKYGRLGSDTDFAELAQSLYNILIH